jgi:hypothetical protein
MIGKGCNIDDIDKLYRTRNTRMLQMGTDLSALIRIISVIGVLYIG